MAAVIQLQPKRYGKTTIRTEVVLARGNDEGSPASDDETFEPDSLNNRKTHRCVFTVGAKSREGLDQDQVRLNKEEERLQRKLRKNNLTQAERKRVKAQYDRFKRKKERHKRMSDAVERARGLALDPSDFKRDIENGDNPNGYKVSTAWKRADTGETFEREADRFARHHLHNIDDIRKYARMPDIASTERFLRKNFKLVCDNTILCMQFQLTDMMMNSHPDYRMWARQIVFMILIVNFARKIKKDPQDAAVLPLYYKERKKTAGKNYERTAYIAEHTNLMVRVKLRMQLRKEEQKQKEEESSNKKQLIELEGKRRQLETNALTKELYRRGRLAHMCLIAEMMEPTFPSHIPQMHPSHVITQRQIRIQQSAGGFCPIDVLRYIPDDMRECFRDQDVLRQQKILWHDKKRIEPHFANAVMAGMWKPASGTSLYCLIDEDYKWYKYEEEPCLRRQPRRKNDTEPDNLIQNLGCEGRCLVFDRADKYNYPGQIVQHYCELTKDIIDVPIVRLNYEYVQDKKEDEIHVCINPSSTMEDVEKAIEEGRMTDKRDEDLPSWEKEGYKSLEHADEHRIDDIKDTIQMIEDAQNTPNIRVPEVITVSGECATKTLMKSPPSMYSSLMNTVEGSKPPALMMDPKEYRRQVEVILGDTVSEYNSVGHGHQELRLACPAVIDGVPVEEGQKGWCKCPDLRCEKQLPNQASLMPRDHSKIWHTRELTAEQLVELFMTPVLDPSADVSSARIGRMMQKIEPTTFEDGLEIYMCIGLSTDGFGFRYKSRQVAKYRRKRPKRKSRKTLWCTRDVRANHIEMAKMSDSDAIGSMTSNTTLSIIEFYSDDDETLPERALKIQHLRQNAKLVSLIAPGGFAALVEGQLTTRKPDKKETIEAKKDTRKCPKNRALPGVKKEVDPVIENAPDNWEQVSQSDDPASGSESREERSTGLVEKMRNTEISNRTHADFDEVD